MAECLSLQACPPRLMACASARPSELASRGVRLPRCGSNWSLGHSYTCKLRYALGTWALKHSGTVLSKSHRLAHALHGLVGHGVGARGTVAQHLVDIGQVLGQLRPVGAQRGEEIQQRGRQLLFCVPV